jgi:hypothetical protein
VAASEIVAATAAGALAGVLAWAGLLKLRDRDATAAALVGLGLGAGLAPTLALVELFTALGLVMERETPWSAVVAIVLLGGFTGFVAVRVARGERRPCPCFGAGSAPMGPPTIVRNLVLIALGVLASTPRRDAWWLAWVVAAATLLALIARTGTRSAAG